MNNDLTKQQSRLFLLLILFAAAALRFYRLNEGLWFDEILTAVRYVRLPFAKLIFAFDSENQHFLYSILAHASVSLFGESSWSLRLPAVLFGVGAIGLTYLFGVRVATRVEALLTCALLSVSYFHIWFSQNARGYTGLQFWTIATGYLLIRCLESIERKKWILYGTLIALGMYTQLTMLFVPIAHFVIFLFHKKRNATGFWFGFVWSAILTLILYAPVLGKFLHTLGEESTVAIWKQPLWTVFEIIRGMKLHFAGGIVAFLAGLIFVAGIVSYWRSNAIVVQLLLLPVLIGSVITIALGHPLWPRFFFFNFAFAMLVLVRGILWFGSIVTANRFGRVPGVAICLLLVAASAAGARFAYAPKQDFIGAQKFVEQNQEEGDRIATVGRISFVYQDFYRLPFEKTDSIDALNRAKEDSHRLWVLYILPEDIRTLYPQVLSKLEKDFDLVKTFDGTLNGGTIYIRRSR